MKASLVISLLCLLAVGWGNAQNPVSSSSGELRPVTVGKLQKPNEVTVVLPPPEPTAPASETPIAEKKEAPSPESTPKPEPAPPTAATVDRPEEEPKQGLSVRVERLQTGSAEIDPEKVKLLAPFPAKLLARSPQGWKIESSENAPPITREVELAPGKRISLSVRPHLLVAESDRSNVFQIAEPGYDPAHGYRQNTTVGAILSKSVLQLDNDSRQLGTVIDQLQQLLVSLPQAPSAAPESPDLQPRAPIRKR